MQADMSCAGARWTPSAATGTVVFNDGSTLLGTRSVSGGQTSFTTSTLSVGSHSITATYSGDSNDATSTSSATTETVAAAATFPGTPTDVLAVVGNHSALISWQPPDTTNRPIDTYTVTAAPGGATRTIPGSACQRRLKIDPLAPVEN